MQRDCSKLASMVKWSCCNYYFHKQLSTSMYVGHVGHVYDSAMISIKVGLSRNLQYFERRRVGNCRAVSVIGIEVRQGNGAPFILVPKLRGQQLSAFYFAFRPYGTTQIDGSSNCARSMNLVTYRKPLMLQHTTQGEGSNCNEMKN